MEFIKTFAVFLVFSTFYSVTDAQIAEIKTATNGTKTTAKLLEGNAQRKGRENASENKQGTEPTSLASCLDPRTQPKVQLSTPKPKSMPIPLNFVINTKPRTIPTKIPLVLKTANVQPAPAHYVRLKADPDRKINLQPKLEVNLSSNKETPKIKVTAQDKVTPKSFLALNAKRQKQTPRKYKFRSVNFFEDDTNIDSLPPALKQPVTRKNKKPESKNDSPREIHLLTLLNEPKQKTRDYDSDGDYSNEVVHIRNGTHAIRITKLQNTGNKEPNIVGTKNQEQIFRENQERGTMDSLVQPLIPQKEEVTVAVLINKDGINSPAEQSANKIETVLGEPSIVTPVTEDGTPDIITITNHNYEEVEERGGAYPENNIDEDSNQPWAIPSSSWKTAATNPYNNYLQNYQTFYDQYLKYIAENNPAIYKKGNCYPRVNLPEQDSGSEPDFTQTYPITNEGQVVQDVFYGQKPENNVIPIRPENNLGRIWRTWKDTEIRITKPNALNMKPVDIGRNLNDMKYSEAIGKTPTLYSNPAIGLNGYYDNLNNPLTYPFPYPTYRYVL